MQIIQKLKGDNCRFIKVWNIEITSNVMFEIYFVGENVPLQTEL